MIKFLRFFKRPKTDNTSNAADIESALKQNRVLLQKLLADCAA